MTKKENQELVFSTLYHAAQTAGALCVARIAPIWESLFTFTVAGDETDVAEFMRFVKTIR